MALVTKNFTLNVTPGAMPPTVHVSEYDIGRTYAVQLLDENGSAYEIPTGTTATVEGTLNGAVGFSSSATISNNQITFALTESMTAYAGKAWCKIKLTQNSQPIQTCAFILAVDRAGVEAETVIGAAGFEEQIRGAVDESVAEYLNDFAIDDEVVKDAVDDYLDENGIDTEAIATATTDWLEENVDPVGSAVVVDSSLSVEGAAADAKAAGDGIGNLKSAIEQIEEEIEGGTGSGLDKTAIDLLETILVSALYNSDQSATISQLIQHLSALLPRVDEIEKVGSALRISNLKKAPTQEGSKLIIL